MLPPGHGPDLLSLNKTRGLVSASRAEANTCSPKVPFEVMGANIFDRELSVFSLLGWQLRESEWEGIRMSVRNGDFSLD